MRRGHRGVGIEGFSYETEDKNEKTFVAMSVAGPKRDLTKGSREQLYRNEHARLIDGTTEGFVIMGGPFDDEGGATPIGRAANEDEARKTGPDPGYAQGILQPAQHTPLGYLH